ncbi:hypothetical protein PFISCL1PPCAC_7152, partial [Pristionchus fissidentatus]
SLLSSRVVSRAMLRLFLALILFIGGSATTDDKSAAFLHSRESTLPVTRLTLTKPYGQFWTHWNVQGKVASTNNEIRLTPAVRGVSGAIWSKTPLAMKAFGLETDFRLASKDGLHADGAAIWFVDQPSNGTAYGVSSNFRGIGIVLDTFQNLDYGGKSFIGIIASDGTTAHNMHNNGKDVSLGKCNVPGMVKVDKYRKQFAETISVYVEYLGSIIRVFYKYPGGEWAYCDDAEVHIPLNFVLGVSAATGELSSRHELIAVRVFEITEPSFVAAVGPDELRFVKTKIAPESTINNDLATGLFVFGVGLVAIVLLVAAILYWDYYYNDDRLFT